MGPALVCVQRITTVCTCIHVTLAARGGWPRRKGGKGWREGAGGRRERKREAERNNAARVSCEYNAESTYRRFQHGVDGDLVVGNSPRLTPPSLFRVPTIPTARDAFFLRHLLFVGPALPRPSTSHIAVSFPSSLFRRFLGVV